MDSVDLVSELKDPDAWRRDTAQRLLVERRDTSIIDQLRGVAVESSSPLGQLHALWTLHGLGGLDPETIAVGLSSPNPKVRSASLRVSESLLPRLGAGHLLNQWRASSGDVPEVQLQLALSLGEIEGPMVLDGLETILGRNLHHPYVVSAVLSSVYQRELEFVEAILDSVGPLEREHEALSGAYSQLAGAVYRERDAVRILGLLKMVLDHQGAAWKADALLAGVQSAAFKTVQGERVLDGDPIVVPEKPKSLVALAGSEEVAVRTKASQLLEAFHWPGKEVQVVEGAAPLSAAEQALFDAGRDLYLISCGACHQPHGRGQDGLAPPLLNSDWVLGNPERITRIVLHGLRGPIEIEGKLWELAMPGLAVFEDEQLASVLTYVRREWGHTAPAISTEFVGSVRAKYGDRIDMWTVEELSH